VFKSLINKSLCLIFSQVFQPTQLFEARFNGVAVFKIFSLRASKSIHRKVIFIPALCSGQLKFVLADSYLKDEDDNQIFSLARIPGPPFLTLYPARRTKTERKKLRIPQLP